MTEAADPEVRLQRLEDRIQQLEDRLEERGHGGPGQKYYESGAIHPELEDQTIAP